MSASDDSAPPYFAPNCRRGEHVPVAHHHRFGQVVGRFCECPCHYATNDGTPWWSDMQAKDTGREPVANTSPDTGSHSAP